VTTNFSVNLLTGSDQLNIKDAINVGPAGSSAGGAVVLTASNISLAAGVTSAGNQTYAGAVTLAGNTTLTSSGNGNIVFSSTIQSPGTAFALAVNTGGSTTFSGAVGGNGNFLGGLTTNNSGSTQINGGSVNSASQTYGDTVTLGASPTTLTGNVAVQGNLILGASAGAATTALQVNGNLTLVNSATLTSTIAGTAASQFGHVAVSGVTNFGSSSLSLNYSNFAPVSGNSFDVVSNGATPIGQFSNATSPGPAKLGGVQYSVSYAGGSSTNDLVLTTVVPPTFTSPASTKFTINSAGTFTVTAAGTSPITFKQTGTLPKGVTFNTSTGVLSGTPTAFGTFNFTFTATNTAGSTTQNFTLVVSGIPAGATTPNQRFISQVYNDLLNRVVDTTGLAAWTNQLNLGVARSQVVLQIETSPSNEYRTIEVQNLYQRYLKRTPDPGGLSASIALLAGGGTIQQLSAALTSSAEFFGLAGGSNTGFLVLLYQDALNRAIDANSLTSLLIGMAMGTASRPTISQFVFSSPEFTNGLVQSIYQNYLNRSADPQGLAFNAQTIANGATYEQVTAFVMGSPEYFLNDVGS
jgi:hypothetical protein